MKKKNYQDLSKRYRETGKGFLSEDEVSAYLLGRMPATKAAIRAVFEEIAPRIERPIERFLDLGAGPGTGLLAFSEVFGDPPSAVLVESNPHMIAQGKKLVEAQWVTEDLFQYEPEEVDCALFGYSYGELDSQKRLDLLKKVFTKAEVLVVVEPGTPRGYENVLEARDFLLSIGGHMVAPCPHARQCPMQGSDWCHFSVRVPRSKEHRALNPSVPGSSPGGPTLATCATGRPRSCAGAGRWISRGADDRSRRDAHTRHDRRGGPREGRCPRLRRRVVPGAATGSARVAARRSGAIRRSQRPP